MVTEVLVTGCGSIGSRHIRNLLEQPDVDVIAHDIDQERLADIASKYQIPTASDLDSALSDGVDCVFVCTPPDTHLELATTAIDAGADVFVEKPLSDSLQGTDEFVRLVESSNQAVYVACNMRFHPPVVQIQQWLDDGVIGSLQFLRLRYGNDLKNWRSTDYRESYSSDADAGGGVVLDAVHELDLASKWMEDAETVYCAAGRLSTLDIDVEDTAEVILESSDRMAEIHLDYIRPERARTYELSGSDGIIRWHGRGKNPEVSTVQLYRSATDEWERREFELTLNEQYIHEIEDFLHCVKTGSEPEMTARRGREVLALAERAKESAESETPLVSG